MRLIVPMAGKGTRLRPHTHVTPKPLLPVVGSSMVERIIDTLAEVLPRPIKEAVFVLGDFPQEVQEQLREICARHRIEAHFVRQEQALGTAHAVYCAKDYLSGEGLIVFADTLFEMEGTVDLEGADGIVWVKWVEDPSRFGVVVREGDRIVAFVEKPSEPISHEAIIGIYYLRQLEALRREIEYLLEHNITGHGNEYQLTDAMDRLLQAGLIFKTASVQEWLDCGTIPALMETTKYYLKKEGLKKSLGDAHQSVIIPPVYLGPGAEVVRSVVGPYVSVEAGARIEGAVVRDSILFSHAQVGQIVLADSLVGQHARVTRTPEVLNVGDHSVVGQGS